MLPESVYNYILDVEGGISQHPDDPGGTTKWGITQTTYRQAGYVGSVLNMTEAACKEIYNRMFWQKVCGDKLWPEAPALALVLFDGAVNHGLAGITRILQLCLRLLGNNLAADGIWGFATTKAVLNCKNKQELAWLVVGARYYYYRSLPGWKTFGRGWENRLQRLASIMIELRQSNNNVSQ